MRAVCNNKRLRPTVNNIYALFAATMLLASIMALGLVRVAKVSLNDLYKRIPNMFALARWIVLLIRGDEIGVNIVAIRNVSRLEWFARESGLTV